MAGNGGSVTGIIGRMGSGKSYLAVLMVYRALSRKGFPCRGCGLRYGHVWTNFTVRRDAFPATRNGTWDKFTTWDDLMDLGLIYDEKGNIQTVAPYPTLPHGMEGPEPYEVSRAGHEGLIIIDEAHLMAPSNKSIVFPVGARSKMAQMRKYGLDLVWVSQHESRVNRPLRDLTNSMWHCRAILGGLFFMALLYEPEKLRSTDAKDKLARKVYFRSDKMRLYDTLEIIDVDATVWGNEAEDAERLSKRVKIRRQKGSSIAPEPPILVE